MLVHQLDQYYTSSNKPGPTWYLCWFMLGGVQLTTKFVTFLSIFQIFCVIPPCPISQRGHVSGLEYIIHLHACICVFVYPLLTTTTHERLVHILQCCKYPTHSVCLRTPAVWEKLYTICLCSVHSLTSTFVVWITPNCGQRRCRFQKDTGSKMSLVQGLQHCLKFRSCMLLH